MVISDAEPTEGRRFRSKKMEGETVVGREGERISITAGVTIRNSRGILIIMRGGKILRENELDELRDLGV